MRDRPKVWVTCRQAALQLEAKNALQTLTSDCRLPGVVMTQYAGKAGRAGRALLGMHVRVLPASAVVSHRTASMHAQHVLMRGLLKPVIHTGSLKLDCQLE